MKEGRMKKDILHKEIFSLYNNYLYGMHTYTFSLPKSIPRDRERPLLYFQVKMMHHVLYCK